VSNDKAPFERSLKSLQDTEFDLLIAGAGMFGACAAWEAALRGYRVALIEREDFCSGVSANSYKIVHGGIRYIQHLDVPRVRSSCQERSSLLRIAPHLVHPLPIAIPTYGYGLSGKFFLATGMYLYDALTADRNRSIGDVKRQIPWTRLMSRDAILEKFPGLNKNGLTGATVFSDAQIYNPPRLVLAFLQSAALKGAVVCNHVALKRYERQGDRIATAHVRDTLTGEDFEIRAKTYLNTMGPWTDSLLEHDPKTRGSLPGVYSRDACFVVKRKFGHELSVALMAQTKDPDAFLSRPARHIFIVPWRDYSLIGTWHKVVKPSPDEISISAEEIDSFIDEIHGAYPALELSRDDVTMCNWGLVPFGENQTNTTNLSYGKRSIIADHARLNGPDNLVSLVGIRVTMGRGDAALAMQAIAEKLGDDQKTPPTNEIPIFGGDIPDVSELGSRIERLLPAGMDRKIAASLSRNHGSNAEALIRAADPEQLKTLGNSHVLEAEITHAVRSEMAMKLSDIVFRRTDLATGGLPDEAALARCADLASELLGLTEEQRHNQLDEIRQRTPGWPR
jgi:glycerol-3-phosphate dehydrogenase